MMRLEETPKWNVVKLQCLCNEISVHYTDHTASNEYHMTTDDYNIQDDNVSVNDSEEQGFSGELVMGWV